MIFIAHSSVDNLWITLSKLWISMLFSVDNSVIWHFYYPQRIGEIPIFKSEKFRFGSALISSSFNCYYLIYIYIKYLKDFKQQQKNKKRKNWKIPSFYSFRNRNYSDFLNFPRQFGADNPSLTCFRLPPQTPLDIKYLLNSSPPCSSRRGFIRNLLINPLIESLKSNLPISGVYKQLPFVRLAAAWLFSLTHPRRSPPQNLRAERFFGGSRLFFILRSRIRPYNLPIGAIK